MSNVKRDIVVVGAGHNTLKAAAYLAKNGTTIGCHPDLDKTCAAIANLLRA
jgi:phytoene dehydrogenase-like protein